MKKFHSPILIFVVLLATFLNYSFATATSIDDIIQTLANSAREPVTSTGTTTTTTGAITASTESSSRIDDIIQTLANSAGGGTSTASTGTTTTNTWASTTSTASTESSSRIDEIIQALANSARENTGVTTTGNAINTNTTTGNDATTNNGGVTHTTTTQSSENINTSSSAETPSFKGVRVETTEDKATFTFGINHDNATIQKFQIVYTTDMGEQKTIITYDKERIKNRQGEYSWYVPNLDPIKKYSFTIAAVGRDNQVISEIASSAMDVEFALGSAPSNSSALNTGFVPSKCMIGNVGGLSVKNTEGINILTWNAVSWAKGYKVYKKGSDGKFVFIADTEDPSYTIYVAPGKVRYFDFSIKGVCADNTLSANFSPTTKIQTGPKEMAFLAIISLGIGYILMRRKQMAAFLRKF